MQPFSFAVYFFFLYIVCSFSAAQIKLNCYTFSILTAAPPALASNESQPEVAAVPDEREDGAFGRLMQGPPVLLPGADKDKRKRKKDSQDSGDKKLQGKGKWSFRGAVPRTGAGSGSGSGGRFFCSDPARNHGHVVFGARHGNRPVDDPGGARKAGLFSWEALQSVCRLDAEALRAPPSFQSLCEREQQRGASPCCASWSIPNYVALLHNRSSCLLITPADVTEVFQRLESCAPHYHSMKLSHDCTTDALLCRGVPQECTEYNAVYNILHFLADADFLGPRATTRGDDDGKLNGTFLQRGGVLSYTNVFLPIAQSVTAMPYFKELESDGALYDNVTEVVAMELGLKHALFDEYLVHDTLYVALAGAAVLAVMWAYTQSFLVTLVTCLAVLFSLGTAYFLYTTVYRVPFFPFMNILTLTIAIGIGADDAFLYCKTWGSAKAEKNNGTLVKLVRDTLHHACLSMLVTSVTTAAAFFASFSSSITAVRCFSLFAGTAVLANFFFTVTWLPAALIVAEKWCSSACCLCVPPFGVYLPRLGRFCINWKQRPPALLLLQDPFHKLPIRVVWGVLPVDTGNYLDPFDRGSLELDPTFNVARPSSQDWLLSFCKRLRSQSFHRPTLGAALYSGCFIETFKSWMERRCVDSFQQADRSPCCESSRFPYAEDVFGLCLRRAIASLHHTPGYYFIPGVAGPRFLRDGRVGAVVLEYDSVYTYSNAHADMDAFRTRVDGWVSREMQGAPAGMRNGWFTSELEFYDLQGSLSRGTLVAMGVAVSVSFVALLVTTLNLLVSLYAIVTIACIIFTTVGALVLLGWKLNVLESITVSVAIGLAVDFTIHYGVAYRLSPQEDRESSVIQSLSRIGSPVAMAAFTTFLSGALMFPSLVLAYLQVGTFLMLVTGVSWTYATFFFQSLLSVAGPQRGRFQLDYPSLRCCDTSAPPAVDKTVYALSESTLSTSSASCPAVSAQIPASESHELEPLTLSAVLNGAAAVKRSGKKKFRQRSGSLSAAAAAAARTHGARRKVSLPVVSVTFHGDPSPRHVSGATSSSTIVCGADEDNRDDPVV
ncbi:hypothetical protein IscW_ISCW000123 [Ixodes scapularis]|uniref:SSD domain-containing protein n=1 Tax=Ixodes scapularis TaxID=6945 RepID=B7P0T8_IXOSC|nr:hypothetical protein IscW_ISCW000123 [Ixodes scapularis]|eukprot:XP_002399364.1 hypothetical protein IscW_ISCW000123 [Ixodes scapularis]